MMANESFLKVMKHFGNTHPTREDYIYTVYAGTPPVDSDGELPAELEAELPWKFQRAALDENVISRKTQ